MSVRFFFDVSIFTCRVAVALINEIVLINFTSHVAETRAAKKWGEELEDPLTNISWFDLNLLSNLWRELRLSLWLFTLFNYTHTHTLTEKTRGRRSGRKEKRSAGKHAQKQREHPVADTDCRCRCRGWCWLAARFPLRTHNLSCGQNVLLSDKRLARFRLLHPPRSLSLLLSLCVLCNLHQLATHLLDALPDTRRRHLTEFEWKIKAKQKKKKKRKSKLKPKISLGCGSSSSAGCRWLPVGRQL